MSTGGAFNVANQLIELDVAKVEIAKEMIMNSQRLQRDPPEPSTDGARRMLVMLSDISL